MPSFRFVAGRRDVPFYYDEAVEVQKSFLGDFLRGYDNRGCSPITVFSTASYRHDRCGSGGDTVAIA